MIDLPVDPRIVGAGVVLRPWRLADVDGLTELWQDPELRRRFAVRAVTALLTWARGDLGLDAFVLEIEPDTVASIAVATALGFVPDGTERRDRSTTPACALARYRFA